MNQLSNALQRSYKFVMASAAVFALGTLAFTVPATLHGDNGKGNAYGKNKDYPYGVNQTSSRPYSIGLWGDLPYSAEQAAVLPNLIADMNSQDLAFTAHDGDLRQGSGAPNCADGSIYARGLHYFDSLRAPAVFTPGDNDWTDCDRQSLYPDDRNSLQELDFERGLFFNTPYTLGQTRFLQEVQSTPTCKGFGTANNNRGAKTTPPNPNVDLTKTQTATYTNVPCVENRRWIVGTVMYATINIQGSCNNLCDDFPDATENAARNAAGIQWMKDTFATAIAQNCVAVMFITQADPGFAQDSSQGGPLRNPNTLAETDGLADGFHDFLVELRKQVVAFGKPVVYVHGDSHYFRVDKPLVDGTPAPAGPKRITNFTRVETFGDHQPTLGDVNWLKVNVDPSSREVFSYEPQIVNRDPVLLVP